jgi:Skp family chaperone for outer membrane proteins
MKYQLRKAVPGLLLACLLGGPVCAQAQTRIGTVDITKIFDGYYKKKQAESILRDRRDELDKALKEDLAKYEKDKADYDKMVSSAADPLLSGEERDRRKKQAEDMFKKLKQSEDSIMASRRAAQTSMEEQSSRMIGRLVDDIRDVVSAKARTAGFSLVLDTAALSAKGTPIVLFNNNETDITDAVLAQLNAGAPLDTTPTANSKKTDDEKATPKKK